MSLDEFDYKNFAAELTQQVPPILPADITEEDKEYIIETLNNYTVIGGEALYNDKSLDFEIEDAEIICQIIAEWTFHKGVDLARSNISREYWDCILQKIAYTIFELSKQGIKSSYEKEKIVSLVEEQVNKVWQECIDELAEKNIIQDKDIQRIKNLSNIDDMSKKVSQNNEKIDLLEKIYNSDSAVKTTLKSKTLEFRFLSRLKIIQKNFVEKLLYYKGLINIFLVVSFILFCSKILYYVLDKINILSLIAEHKVFMYILFVISLIGISVFGWYKLNQKALKDDLNQLQNIKYSIKELVNPDNMYDRLGVESVRIQIGKGLLSLTDNNESESLLTNMVVLRQELTDELGYIVPNIRIIDNDELEEYEYTIEIRNNVVSSGFVYPNKYMVIAEQWDFLKKHIPDDAIIGVDPTYKTQAYWISEQDARKAEKVVCVSTSDVIKTHLKEMLIKHVEDVLTMQDVQKLINFVNKQEPKLYSDIKDHGVTEYDLQKILRNLIREKVSVKDIVFVFERLSDYSRYSQEPDILSERLRAAFGRKICLDNVDKDNVLYALSLSPEWENTLDESTQRTELGKMFLLNPVQVTNLTESTISTLMKIHQQIGQQPVILCSPRIRLPLYELLVRHIPTIVVISYSELIKEIKVDSVGVIE